MIEARYTIGLTDGIADVVCAIDLFFSVREPAAYLKELRRTARQDGMLVLDDGHQSRATSKEKLLSSNCRKVVEETRDHLKCEQLTRLVVFNAGRS